MGAVTVYVLGAALAGLRALGRPVERRVKQAFYAVKRALKRLRIGATCTRRALKSAFAAGFWRGIGHAVKAPVRLWKHHRYGVRTLLNVAAPLAAAAALMVTLFYWSGLTFGLGVTVDGNSLGVVADATTYDAAAAMAQERVINTDNSFSVSAVPQLTLTVSPRQQLLSENEVCDLILQNSGGAVEAGSGLYVDNRFIAAMPSHAALQGLLDTLMVTRVPDPGDGQRQFVENVQIVDGLYPASAVLSADAMQAKIAGAAPQKRVTVAPEDTAASLAATYGLKVSDLLALNNMTAADSLTVGQALVVEKSQPLLQVQTVKTLVYQEPIPFDTQRVDNFTMWLGTSTVSTAGKAGVSTVTAQAVYVDGTEVSRTILSRTTVSTPVTQVVQVGQKRYNTGVNGDGIATGKFTWPLPAGHIITSPFGWRNIGRGREFHSGIDIAGGSVMGKPIVAADGGTVKLANYNPNNSSGYGMYIIIDHGGGFTTLYAHCSAIKVNVGDKVTKGQEIALVGQTGDATGPHLHFEVRINGVAVNPLLYVSMGS